MKFEIREYTPTECLENGALFEITMEHNSNEITMTGSKIAPLMVSLLEVLYGALEISVANGIYTIVIKGE